MPLSKVNNRVRASEWLKKHGSIPKNVGDIGSSDIQAAMGELERPMIVPNPEYKERQREIAEDFFQAQLEGRKPKDLINEFNPHKFIYKTQDTPLASVDVRHPQSIKVDVKIKTPPVSESLDVAKKVEAANSALSKKKDPEIESLVNSIMGLTAAIKDNVLSNKQATGADLYDERKHRPKSAKDLLATIVKDKAGEVKSMFSIRNALQTAGVRSAFKGSESVLDKILSFREDRIKENREKKQAEPPKRGLITSTILGTGEYAARKAISPIVGAKGVISRSSISQKIAKSISDYRDSLDKRAAEEDAKQQERKELFKQKLRESPNSLLGSIYRRYDPKIFTTVPSQKKQSRASEKLSSNSNANTPDWVQKLQTGLPDNVKQAIRNPDTPEAKQIYEGVKDGIRDELLGLNKDQLTQLKILVAAATTTSKENKLEKNIKGAPAIAEKREEKKQDENKSIFKSLFDSVKGLRKSISGIGKALDGALSKVGSLLKFAAPGLAVGAAGALGYGAGTLLNEKAINPLVQKMTGQKDATLGTAIYDAVDNVKGWFGNSDADKMREAEEAAKANSPLKKSTTDSSASALSKAEASIAVPTMSSQLSELAGKSTSPLTKVGTDIKPASSYRVDTVNRIQTTLKETERIKEQALNSSSSRDNKVIDARSTVNNTSNTIQTFRPPIANPDHTFNKLLRLNFNY